MRGSRSVVEKKLADGTTLKLIEQEKTSPHYQLNLVDGFITYQFPTTERLKEERVRNIYDSVNSSGDFQRVLKSCGPPAFLTAQNRYFSRKK